MTLKIRSVAGIQCSGHQPPVNLHPRPDPPVFSALVIWPGEQADIPRERLHAILVERSLRARLALQSIVTGRLSVELGFFPGTPVHYQLPLGERVREIPTIPSELEELRQLIGKLPLGDIAGLLTRVLQGVDRLVNDPETQSLVEEINGAAKEIRTLAHSLNDQVDPFGSNMDATLEEIRGLARRLDGEARLLSDGLQKMAAAVANLADEIDDEIKPLARELRSAARSAEAGFDAAKGAFDKANNVLREDSPMRFELMRALRNVSAAARSLHNMADYLERHPEALLRGKRLQ